jgi:signal transduction histidine kinase/ActR/RegA family two-component response regulator
MSAGTSLELSKMQAAVTHWFSDETHQGLFVTDTQFRVVVWNRWMELHSGRAASDMMGRSLFDVYKDVIARGIKDYYEHALAGHVTIVSHALHRYILPMRPTHPELAFSEMPQSGHIGPLNHDGAVIGTITIVEDVSDPLASEAQLRKQIAALQAARTTAENALRAKDEFLSTLSHEIRTPLSAVLGWVRILLGREAIDRALLERGLHVIERNATAQAKIIDDMLDMARIVAGKLRLEKKLVRLQNIVPAAVDAIMPAATAKGVTVRTTLNPTTPQVNGDPDRLQQVVWNLLSNALKFTDAGGTVDVRLDVSAKYARISVSDNGQGISPEFLPSVFERFRQNDASSTRRHGGLGLGLALVRELVELHAGSVRAESAGLNEGSTFTIDLPTVVSAEIVHGDADRHDGDQDGSASLVGVRVLVVEDEPDARELAVMALEHRGAEVMAVPSSSAGVSAILSSPYALPHVLVSDIGMPEENGYDFIKRVRALDPSQGGRIPAVSVTAYTTPKEIDQALAAGYQLHVPKPMDPAALVKAVAKLVRRTANREPSRS